MKPGNSSLNPYATSYIPLSKRKEHNKAFGLIAGHPENGDGTAHSGAPSEKQQVTKQNHVQVETSVDLIHGIEELLVSENGTRKGNAVYRSLSDMTGKQRTHEDSEMDLAYLAILFPGISDQSLADVYNVNEGDLDASVDMLHQLEVYPADVSQHLLDSLDVGDLSGFDYPAEGSSVRLNQTTSGEASGSSSCSLKSAS